MAALLGEVVKELAAMPAYGMVQYDAVPLGEIERQFFDAMARAGVAPRDGLSLVFDTDKPVRFPVEGDRGGEKSGWYILHSDKCPAGAFGDWHGDKYNFVFDFKALGQEYDTLRKWCSTPEYRAEQERKRQEREQRQRDAEAKAADVARAIFDNAPPAPENHPYLMRKRIINPVLLGLLKVDGGNNLLVPLKDIEGRFLNLQRIPEEEGARKLFQEGATTKGGFFLLGDLAAGDILVCEGFATAATIHEMRGQGGPTLAAMSCGNLKPVCQALRQRYPGRKVYIMADDDAATAKRIGKNPGMAAAAECRTLGLCDGVCPPPFDRAQDGDGPSDWNDYASLHGLSDTARALAERLKEAQAAKGAERPSRAPVSDDTLNALCIPLDKNAVIQPEALIGGLFPRGRVSAIVGAAGVGKTWFLLRLASDLSTGGSILGGFAEVEPCNVLIFEGEAGVNMVLGRLKGASWQADKGRVHVVDLGDSLSKGIDWDLSKPQGLENFSKMIDMRRPDLVFLDSLFSFAGVDENKAVEVNPLMQDMLRIAKDKDIALVLVHHTRKRKSMERRLILNQDDAIGSSILNRSVAQLIGLQSLSQLHGTEGSDEAAPVLVRPLKSWYKHFKKFTFQLTESLYGKTDMVFDLNPPLANKDGDAEDKVAEYIFETFEPGVEFKRSDVSMDGVSDRTLKRVLSDLVKTGELKRLGSYKNAKYFIPANEDEAEGGEGRDKNIDNEDKKET